MTFKNFTSDFSDAVRKFSNKPAIITDSDYITYQELHELSNYFAQCILNHGVAAEEIIPIVFERSIDMITAMLAILKSGCAFLPINPLTPCERQLFISNDTNARIFLTNDPSLIRISRPNMVIINLKDKIKSSLEITPSIKRNNLAYVMYTSGSTGDPKGVMIEHDSMMNLFLSLIEKLHLNESERVLALTDYTFDISLIELLLPLTMGATIVLTSQGTIADGSKIKKYLTQYDISLMQATPISWQILLKHEWHNNGLLKILIGGEKLSTRLANALNYQKGNIFNMYGPTETSMWSMYYRLEQPLVSHSVPLGEALANTTIYLLDENFNPVPPGKEGQICIGGQGLARGYLNNPALTHEKFIIHPESGERLYQTGDLAVLDKDNLIYYIGRRDDQFKLNGIRIESGEIEKFIEQETFVKKAIVKIHEQDNYFKVLSAYIEIDEAKAFNSCSDIIEDISINPIKNIYNSIYCQASAYENELINNSGWHSTFTGQALLPQELKESYQFLESTISKSDLSAVLEIGSGAGSLLKTFIDKVGKYTVVEISEQSINYIKNQLSATQLEKITFKNQSIIDINEEKNYSCVIINSVIQYLPSINYLITSLKKIIKACADACTIIIGDVRSLELMEVFLLKKNNKPTYYRNREGEIVLSPNFFIALKDEIPEISAVDIAVKSGVYENELNYFRYDVILHINKPILFQTPIIVNYDHNFDLPGFQNLLKKNAETPLILKNIPNSAIIKMLDNLESQHPLLVKKNLTEYRPGLITEIDTHKINYILTNYFENHEKFIHYDSENPISKLEIYFYPKSQKMIRVHPNKPAFSYPHYGREPFNPRLQEFCFNKIKYNLAQHLISWIRPSVYIWVEKWPLTTNGKIDKKSLEFKQLLERKSNNEDTLLSHLQKIWENTTGNYSEITRSFEEQGVSSLYLYFFLATINETYGINLSYQELKKYNTLFNLAHYIESFKKETI